MKKYSGFTLLEILLYVVIGGVTLFIASFSFIQINRLATSFRVNNELNQNGAAITEQIQNLINDADIVVTPKSGDITSNSLVLRKGIVDITIAQSTSNISVSYSDNSVNFYNLNPTGILISNTPSPTLSFQQINTKDNIENIGLSQTIKLKFTLRYNKPTFSGFEYDSTKDFETTLNLSKKTSSFQPILNTQPTGANGVAYGLRKLAGFNTNTNALSSAYNGSAIRVRRDNGLDQNEMDIGFTSKGDLDIVALQNFVGYQNFLNYSEDITSSTGGWTLNNITTISDNTTAPDVTNTAEKFNLSAGNNNRFIAKSSNVVNGSIYTDSYYVKANNGYNFVQIVPETGFSTTAYQNYNLSNGTLGSSSGVTSGQANIQSVGNSWYRISLSATANTSTTGRMLLAIVNSATSVRLETVNITNATDSIFVWGGMRHLNTSLTNPTKTYQKTLANANTGDGYITTWYDQSGNKNNAIQTTTNAQPKIVDGVTGIVYMNSKPALRFDGSNDQLSNTSFNNATNSTAFFIASRSNSTQSFMARSINYSILGSPDLFNSYYLNKSNSLATTGSDTKNSLNLYTAIRNSAINSTLNIGAGSAGNFLNGNISELIIYDGNKLSIRTAVENNLRDYYGTP
jgi:hypothetical protein